MEMKDPYYIIPSAEGENASLAVGVRTHVPIRLLPRTFHPGVGWTCESLACNLPREGPGIPSEASTVVGQSGPRPGGFAEPQDLAPGEHAPAVLHRTLYPRHSCPVK